MDNNRRRYERFPFYESVGFQKREELPLEGSLSEDISIKGLKLNVNEFIPLNSVLELQVRLPGKFQVIFVPGKVVWVRESPKCIDGWQVGIELIGDDNKPSISDIENYIRLQRFKAF